MPLTPAHPRLAALLALSALCPAAAALGGPAKSFRVTSYKDFAEGQENGVVLSSQGEALSGVSATRLALPSLSDDSVRALAQGEGGTVYVGTGGDGPAIHIYEKGQLRKLLRLEASTWVTALCPLPRAPSDRRPAEVLAATAQDGRLFAITAEGKSRVHATLEADHVWAMVADARRGLVYAATGPGRLYAVDGKGKSRKLFDSGARQILGLTQGDDGMLYVGTADDAVLYRVDPDHPGAARALHDFAGNELRALAFRKGTLYAAVNDMQRGETGTPRPGVRIVPAAAGSAPGSGGGKPAAPGGGGASDQKGKGALYRIEPDGRVEQLHAISDGFFNALHVDEGGSVYAAASTPGGRGRVYLVRPDRTVLTALELKESDVLSLSIARERLVGTGNSGALYRLGDAPPKDAHYLSKVFDGQYPSRWGGLRYWGAGPLRVETRSGNLAKPDATWSPWQGVQRSGAEGGGAKGLPSEWVGKIASPVARYLQVKLGFGDKAQLQDFTVSYQPLNQRPRVTEILVGEDPSGRLARGTKSTALKPRQALVKLRWKAENPDEDELVYRLYVRPLRAGKAGEGPEEGWLRLGGIDPLTKTEYEWNTEAYPDGAYEAKVVASDERANPGSEVLSHELVSPPFIVDNRKPELRELAYDQKAGTVSGRAADATSPIAELAYAVDGGDFLPVGAQDGVLDDLAEEFRFRLPRLAPGPHTVVVRATDGADNAVAAQLVVQVR